MGHCIDIIGVEHLPLENTLLISYSITCSGTWNLLQNDSAYRNVCDDYWTVMYPNTQHPRHTDFPISVASNSSIQGTFAWNYGGIQGIGSENFDPMHSYLVQLGIYNLDCNSTTQTGTTGSSGVPGSGSGTTGTTGSNTSFPGGRPPRNPPVPGIPDPPTHVNIPTPASPVDPGVSIPPGGGSTGSGIQQYVPVAPIFVENNSNPNQDPTLVVTVTSIQTNPFGTEIGYQIPPRIITTPAQPIGIENGNSIIFNGNTTSIPTNGSTFNLQLNNIPAVNSWPSNISNIVFIQTNPNVMIPNLNNGGGIVIQHPDINPAIGSIPITVTQQDISESNIDTALNTYSMYGNTDGNLSRFNYDAIKVDNQASSVSLRYLDTSSILPTSKATIKISTDDIIQGEALFVSTLFKTPSGVEIYGHSELWLVDSQNRNILVKSTTDSIFSTSSIACKINTHQSPVGPNTFLLIVKDSSGRVVGVTSKKFIIRPIVVRSNSNQLTVLKEPNNNIVYNKLPAFIVDLLHLRNDYLETTISNTNEIYYILEKIDGSRDLFSAIAIAEEDSADYSMTLLEYSSVSNANFKLKKIYNTTVLGFSENRVLLDGQELFPKSHNVGLAKISTNDDYLVLSISKRGGEIFKSTKLRIYLCDSYKLKEITSSVSTSTLPPPDISPLPAPTYLHTVTLNTPYAGTTLGLINHGPRNGYISDDYTVITANTDIQGNMSYYFGSSIRYGDYYSLVVPVNGVINPYKGIVYTSKI